MPHILIVGNKQEDGLSPAEMVTLAPSFTSAVAEDLGQARKCMAQHSPDVVFTDLKLPDGSGVDLLREVDTSTIEVIVVTDHASVETAVRAFRLGASDYLVKPLTRQRIKSTMERLPHVAKLRKTGCATQKLDKSGRFGNLMGRSQPMHELYRQISRVAPTDASILLIGESGTGKELVARLIHQLSARQSRTFLAVNCGAISPTLIESEVFGHARGSFTSAAQSHKGYFEQADGGTLFLDEITEMPAALQTKLLRVLETGSFMRVGTSQEICANVRVIAATNRDPAQTIQEGKLRLDLYHRLNIVPLRLPPLRERIDDLDMLVQHFLNELNKNYRTIKQLARNAGTVLRGYEWPGNVRELKNYLHRAYIVSEGDEIDLTQIPVQVSLAKPHSGAVITVTIGTRLNDMDRQLILATLEQCGGVKKRAAKLLGISLKTLYNRLSEYDRDGLMNQNHTERWKRNV